MPLRILLLYLIRKFNKSIERYNKEKTKELEQKVLYLDNKMQYLREENVPQRLAHYSQIISTNPNSPDAYV